MATYLMRTSKFQGVTVTLVYCMEQIRDALTIRSLSKISYVYQKVLQISIGSVSIWYLYQITSRSDILNCFINST